MQNGLNPTLKSALEEVSKTSVDQARLIYRLADKQIAQTDNLNLRMPPPISMLSVRASKRSSS